MYRWKKEKLRQANTGKKTLEETKKKQSITSKGIKKSKEHCKNISEAKKGDKNPQYGKKRSLREKALIGIGQSGKNNYQYIALDFNFLILLYFKKVSLINMRKIYNETFNKNISLSPLKRFLKILNFPINSLSKGCSKKKQIYLNFVEENKNKIDWYIENYERLEEEYLKNNIKKYNY